MDRVALVHLLFHGVVLVKRPPRMLLGGVLRLTLYPGLGTVTAGQQVCHAGFYLQPRHALVTGPVVEELQQLRQRGRVREDQTLRSVVNFASVGGLNGRLQEQEPAVGWCRMSRLMSRR